MALGNLDTIEVSLWTFSESLLLFSCICFANSPWILTTLEQFFITIQNPSTAQLPYLGIVRPCITSYAIHESRYLRQARLSCQYVDLSHISMLTTPSRGFLIVNKLYHLFHCLSTSIPSLFIILSHDVTYIVANLDIILRHSASDNISSGIICGTDNHTF